MTIKVVRFASLFLTALAAGVALSHALEMPNKLVLNGDTWIRVQQGLYHGFGTFRVLVETGGEGRQKQAGEADHLDRHRHDLTREQPRGA